MSLRLIFVFFLLWSLAINQSFGQQTADFTFDDTSDMPASLRINLVGPDAISINPNARSDGEGVYTLNTGSTANDAPNIDLEIPESLLNQSKNIYMEFDFRSQEEFGWLIYSGYRVDMELFRLGHRDAPGDAVNRGLHVRYSTTEDPHNIINSDYVAPLERGERAMVAFMYNIDEGTAYIMKNGEVVWETPEAEKSPGHAIHWQTENGSFIVGSHMNGNGSTTPSLYRFRLFEDQLCTDISPPTAENDTICGSGQLLLQAEGGEPGQYRWYREDGETLIEGAVNSSYETNTLTQPGTYTFYVSLRSETCESALVPVQAIVKPQPEEPQPLVTQDCASGEVSIELPDQQNGTVYHWLPHPDARSVYQGSSLTLQLEGDTLLYVKAAGHQCESELVPVDVRLRELPTIDVGEDLTILKGESIELSASGTYSSLYWQPHESLRYPDSPTPLVKPEFTHTYTVTAVGADGCEISDQITVVVLNKLPVPNAFSPNDDGLNDTWEIPNIEKYPKCRILVFNRWGNQVFSSEGYQEPWDGTNRGKPLANGTYYYTIQLNNEREPEKGSVLIIR